MPNPITGQPYSWEVSPVPQTPNYTDPNFAFGYSQPMGSTAMNQASLTNPQAQPMGSAALTTPNPVYDANAFNVTGTNQSVYNTLDTTAPAQQDLFAGITGGDWLNFGTNLAGLGAGIYYQNQALGQQQEQLDLARDKYNTYQQEQADLDAAYASFG